MFVLRTLHLTQVSNANGLEIKILFREPLGEMAKGEAYFKLPNAIKIILVCFKERLQWQTKKVLE